VSFNSSTRGKERREAFQEAPASLEYSLSKLEANRRELGRGIIEVTAARLRLIEQRDQAGSEIRKYRQQAELALGSGREDLVRSVLERKGELEKRLAEMEIDLTNLDHQLEILKQSQLALESKIDLFFMRKEELKSMYDSSRAQLRVREALSGVSAGLAEAGNTIGRIERRIANMRARTAAINQLVSEGVLKDALGGGGDDTDRQLSQLQRSQAVESELARLKEEATQAAE
jgi:phage shock protein A